jgi:hypothetical protein
MRKRAWMESWVAASILLWAVGTRAQDEGVANSGMGQGEASINVRSDVRLGIKGTGGTTSERLAKLGAAVGDRMTEIRGCYRKLVATKPELVGGLRALLVLEEGKKPKVEVAAQDAQAGKELVECVEKVLVKTAFDGVGRPAAAQLTLDFDNTRARGQAVMNQRTVAVARIDVTPGPDGTQQAVWSTDGGAVTFTVRAAATAPREQVELVMRGLQAGYAAFLDCRRHCEKGDVSPEGDILASLVVDRQGKSTAKLGKISVANERAPRCAERSFRQLAFDKPANVVRSDVTVHFAK